MAKSKTQYHLHLKGYVGGYDFDSDYVDYILAKELGFMDGINSSEEKEDLLEHRTDGTDAFDTLYIGCEKFPQANTNNGFSISGVI